MNFFNAKLVLLVALSLLCGETLAKKITISSDDPKAFTKSLLYQKQGYEVEIVDKGKKKPAETGKLKEVKSDSTETSEASVPKVSKDPKKKEDSKKETVKKNSEKTEKAKKEVAKKEEPKKKAEKKQVSKKEPAKKESAKKQTSKKEPKPKESGKKESLFDFSKILIPITHEARLGSPYGIRDHRLHRGVDVQVEKGEPMVAAYPGKVIVSKYNPGGYGHYVLVEHANGLQTLYGHLAKRSVKVDDYVYPGDIVGLAGNTGKSSGAHLHFEIRYGEINIDPATIIDFPHWKLKPLAAKFSMTKATQAHRKLQAKLSKENVYVVKKGDTISDVANWFYISEDAVRRINHLAKGAPLKVGQRLKGSN